MILLEDYTDLVTVDGFDEAIIGVVERIGLIAVCYDRSKVIQILMRDMNEDDAWEYYHYNVVGAYVGEATPVFLDTVFHD